MPISPKPVVPRSRPASADDASVKPRDTTAPTSAQNAPTGRRIGTESLGPADRTSSLFVTAVTLGIPFATSTPALRVRACSLSIAVGARTGSGQEALDLLAHAVELLWRHVRVQWQSQGLPARRHGLLHPLAHPMCHPSQEGLL